RFCRKQNVYTRVRSLFYALEEDATAACAKGLAWILVVEDRSLKGRIAKFIGPGETANILQASEAVPGDEIVFMADEAGERASKLMGVIRDKLGNLLDLIEKDVFRFCWIVDFPMYELNPDTGKIEFSHNPFSMPQGALAAINEKDPLHLKAFQ